MRADDIRKGSEFEQLCEQTTNERKQEEESCDHFITSSRQRYHTNALRLKEKFLSQMINDKMSYLNDSILFWKLDPWEDDLRRRRRLISNLNGSLHNESIENSSLNENNDDMITTIVKEEYLLKQIQKQKTQNFLQDENDDLSQIDEKDLEQDFSGPIRYSTECLLINGTTAVQGILAITHNAMLFDANEEQNIDSKVIKFNKSKREKQIPVDLIGSRDPMGSIEILGSRDLLFSL
jgi:hypothetical protein